ncbi:hypothetical protein HY837_04825 [archaeon]|nr:hypothetical protein [archaeon]
MIEWLIFILIVSLFGIIVGLFYKTLKTDKVNKIIRLISGLSSFLLIYYSFYNKYFLIPLIILAVCLPFKRNFSAISFFSNFGGVLALIFSIQQFKTDYVLFFIVVALFFNSLLSIFSIAVESQQEIQKAGKTKKKEFELKPPFYYYALFYSLNIISLLGVVLSLARQTYYLAILLFFVFIIFSLAVLLIKKIKVEPTKLIIKNILKKEEIKLNNVKKAVLKIVPGGWSMPTNILELYLDKKIERIDIRTHYNGRDTAEFIAVLKKSLGKKITESEE